MAERVPATLLAPLADLGRWLDAIRTQAVIVGGVAVSFLGRPRFTQDIDVLAILSEQEWESAVAAAPTYGLLDAHPDANVDAVRQWVREFATATAMSDLIEDFEKVLARRKATR